MEKLHSTPILGNHCCSYRKFGNTPLLIRIIHDIWSICRISLTKYGILAHKFDRPPRVRWQYRNRNSRWDTNWQSKNEIQASTGGPDKSTCGTMFPSWNFYFIPKPQKNITVCWENFRWNWNHFQWYLFRVKEHDQHFRIYFVWNPRTYSL